MNERDVTLKTVVAGREVLAPGYDLPRHRHLHPYAIVVIRGSFEQVSYAGRIRVTAGQLLIQPPLDCHANQLVSPGAEILRLAWPDVAGLGGVHTLADLDAIVRAAERDLHEAHHLARAGAGRRLHPRTDLPDELARALVAGEVTSLRAWSQQRGLARETVARAFRSAYGVDARRFRAELAARAAWLQITTTKTSLAEIALATAFADQAHMTRSVRAHTGLPPARWRASS